MTNQKRRYLSRHSGPLVPFLAAQLGLMMDGMEVDSMDLNSLHAISEREVNKLTHGVNSMQELLDCMRELEVDGDHGGFLTVVLVDDVKRAADVVRTRALMFADLIGKAPVGYDLHIWGLL